MARSASEAPAVAVVAPAPGPASALTTAPSLARQKTRGERRLDQLDRGRGCGASGDFIVFLADALLTPRAPSRAELDAMNSFCFPVRALIPWINTTREGLYVAWSCERVLEITTVRRPHWTIYRALGLRGGARHAVANIMIDYRDMWLEERVLVFDISPPQ